MSFVSKVIKSMDSLTNSGSTKMALNGILENYCELTDLTLNGKDKKIYASVKLKGESSVVNVKIERYKISNKDSNPNIVIHEAKSDKEWLNAILNDFVIGKTFNIPKDKFNLVEELL